MGMYTALHFGADLKLDTPDQIVNILRYMLDEKHDPHSPPATPEHPLFGVDTRWRWMLMGDSWYFRHESFSKVIDCPGGGHTLSITCNLKNYNDEISKFLDWIMPYVMEEPGGWLGYWMYEEDEIPTLIFFPGGENDGT
jgi:hypothetical protein